MHLGLWVGGAALAMSSALALAQRGPESLLPPGFENPAPAPRATPTKAAAPAPAASPVAAPASVSIPVVQALPASSGDASPSAPAEGNGDFLRIPSVEELAKMTPEDFEGLLRSHQALDIPAGARRSMARAGLIDEADGGIPAGSTATQNPRLVRLALAANRGALISRWGHILLRRALASRLPAPRDMTPEDFLALRVSLLLRMGETDAARAVLQDIDSGAYTPEIDRIALDVYTGTADVTGICPAMPTQGSVRSDAPWRVVRAICNGFRGNGSAAMQQLDHERFIGSMAPIDLALAQKYAGAAGKARRAVTIDWEKVEGMSRWRYGLAMGTGLQPPAVLLGSDSAYASMAALAPMAPLARRAEVSDFAAGRGLLSAAALVDLYGQIYADPDLTGQWQDRAETLRKAYVDEDASARIAAIRTLWAIEDEAASLAGPQARYGRMVLTAYAAARMAPADALSADAPQLIASMLTAGLDANAMRWAPVVEPGSQGWALLALAAPRASGIDTGALDSFIDDDASEGRRKAAFLVAGLAGLGRIDARTASSYSDKMDLKLAVGTRWTQAIDSAASHGDVATTVMLAGLGMQGVDWSQMTPRYLFHIVGALSRAGLRAEARMIAAEAVARA